MNTDQGLSIAAQLTERLCALPAVATLDWCDRAAAAIADLCRPAATCLLIGTIDAHGRILDLEAAGVSICGADGSTALPATIGESGEETPGDPRLNELRCRAERLPSIGFTPSEPVGAPMAASLSTLPGGAAWRSGLLGVMWEWSKAAELLVGAIRLGETATGRVLVVYVAPLEGAADELLVQPLRAVMPVLSRKALTALGTTRSNRNRWISPREQTVLDQLILGKSVRQIADDLGRSPHTVHDHVKSLHRKLNASSRGELVARALGHLHECVNIRHTAKPARAAQTVEPRTSIPIPSPLESETHSTPIAKSA